MAAKGFYSGPLRGTGEEVGDLDRRVLGVILVAVAVTLAVMGAYLATTLLAPPPSSPPPPPPPPLPPPDETSDCPLSEGLCVEREVTRVVDGDTLDVAGDFRIRLVLVDAPELGAAGGPEARDYLTDLCLGTTALVDEDDFQIGEDPFGRVLAVVHCDGTNANAALIASRHAETYFAFCDDSEFGEAAWTGCASPPPEEECDPAYPGVCIPSPPPDLDCGDIPFRNFQVLPPDPHHFDGDGDGVGCEG